MNGSDGSTQAAQAAAHAYIEAFNRGDIAAMADAFNFPHIRLAGGQFATFATREAFLERREGLKRSLDAEGWDHTVVRSIDVVHARADKVHMSLLVDRCRADGTVYNQFQTLWIATCQDGHWGIQFRSSYLT